MNDDSIFVQALQQGDLVVMPSDTIYGIFACAINKKAVAKLYRARGRNSKKPCIILIDTLATLQQFDIALTGDTRTVFKTLWSSKSAQVKRQQLRTTSFSTILKQVDFRRPITVVLSCTYMRWHYLHRGTQTLAFRMPSTRSKRSRDVHRIVQKVGPLIAPSANPEGKKPAETCTQAHRYFGDVVVACRAGMIPCHAKASQVVAQMQDGGWRILRT